MNQFSLEARVARCVRHALADNITVLMCRKDEVERAQAMCGNAPVIVTHDGHLVMLFMAQYGRTLTRQGRSRR
jgi:hypothetical protein